MKATFTKLNTVDITVGTVALGMFKRGEEWNGMVEYVRLSDGSKLITMAPGEPLLPFLDDLLGSGGPKTGSMISASPAINAELSEPPATDTVK